MRRGCRERFPRHRLKKTLVSDPGSITARAWRTYRDACRDRKPAVEGKTFPPFPAHAQPEILRVWQEAHGRSYYPCRKLVYIIKCALAYHPPRHIC